MPLKVLIVPDKFKGTLPAGEVAEAIARGWRKSRPRDVLDLLPMSDGGDGFGEVMGRLLGARLQTAHTVDAAGRPCSAPWWWEPRSRTAIVESAAVIGLAKLPAGRFHPFELDTFGLGAVLKAAAKKEATRCLVGIGGSATNDAGFGVARALGGQFLDKAGRSIDRWIQLEALARIRHLPTKPLFKQLLVAVDVNNPLLGPRGATRVYGPQKGLRPNDFPAAESCLRRLAAVARKEFGRNLAGEPGAGAAGGLGFGLATFLGARLVPGFELFVRYSRLRTRLRKADYVVTGEGGIDRSTLMGKGVGQVGRLCLAARIPCFAIAGITNLAGIRNDCFSSCRALTEITALENAQREPAIWIESLARDLAGGISEP